MKYLNTRIRDLSEDKDKTKSEIPIQILIQLSKYYEKSIDYLVENIK